MVNATNPSYFQIFLDAMITTLSTVILNSFVLLIIQMMLKMLAIYFNCCSEKQQSHNGCICLTFLHCVFSNVLL